MINGKTSLVGLLGQPVSHSLSPAMHNAALKEMGLNWCYLAMPCSTADLKDAIRALRHLNCKGLNITIPHKQNAIKACEKVSPLAKKLGAINTLVPIQGGGWLGDNTDIEGFLAPLKLQKWEESEAIVLGCGGSARAVVAGLQTLNFKQISIVGRKKESLNHFLKDLELEAYNSSKEKTLLQGLLTENSQLINEIKKAKLIVNTTPVGMRKGNKNILNAEQIPLGKDIWKYLTANTTLYDLIYTPRPTPWLEWGSEKGCKQIDGLEMLIQQGAASLKLWTGKNHVPIEVMRKAAKRHLKN